MKKFFSVVATGSLLTLMAVVAHAQLPGTAIRARIPFEFTVRGRTLPAGNYEITRINDEALDLKIQNVDHKRDETLFETLPLYERSWPHRNVLVFHRYGESYFLSEVVTAGEQTARELRTSRAERQARRDTAKNQEEMETVTVALN